MLPPLHYVIVILEFFWFDLSVRLIHVVRIALVEPLEHSTQTFLRKATLDHGDVSS